MDYSDVTVVIPTLNEGKNIGKLINILKKLYKGINVIVSDDGSKDETKMIVKSFKSKKIVFFDRSKEKIHGLTASVVDAARTVKTPYIIVMDGDLQHPPQKIKEIYNQLKDFDIVIGKRIKGLLPKKDFIHIYRFAMSRIATLLARLRLLINGIICKDPMSGFFGVKINLINNVPKDYFELEGYKVLFDLMKKAPKKTKLTEVDYAFGVRYGGESKISNKHIKVFLKSLFK